MQQRLGGHAEYADRMTLGTIELIVRDVDEDGKIISVGLSLEPAPAAASIPAFLSPVELDRPDTRLAQADDRRRRRPTLPRKPKSRFLQQPRQLSLRTVVLHPRRFAIMSGGIF